MDLTTPSTNVPRQLRWIVRVEWKLVHLKWCEITSGSSKWSVRSRTAADTNNNCTTDEKWNIKIGQWIFLNTQRIVADSVTESPVNVQWPVDMKQVDVQEWASTESKSVIFFSPFASLWIEIEPNVRLFSEYVAIDTERKEMQFNF